MHQLVSAACMALLISASALPAESAWLSNGELEKSCDEFLADPASEAGSPCLAYVQGYLAASDPTGAIRYQVQPESDESFAERAARTRLGTLRLQLIKGADPAYCVGENVPPYEVVRRVMAYLREASGGRDLSNAKALREALADKFPCDDDEAGN